MSQQAKWEYRQAIYNRYQQTSRAGKQQILNGLCQVTRWNRKHAIRLLEEA